MTGLLAAMEHALAEEMRKLNRLDVAHETIARLIGAADVFSAAQLAQIDRDRERARARVADLTREIDEVARG